MKKILRRGFTLIELLIVIAIIGILASVLFSTFGSAKTRANDSNFLQGMKNTQTVATACILAGIDLNTPAAGTVVCTNETAQYPAVATGWSYNTTGNDLTAAGDNFSFGATATGKTITCDQTRCQKTGF